MTHPTLVCDVCSRSTRHGAIVTPHPDQPDYLICDVCRAEESLYDERARELARVVEAWRRERHLTHLEMRAVLDYLSTDADLARLLEARDA